MQEYDVQEYKEYDVSPINIISKQLKSKIRRDNSDHRTVEIFLDDLSLFKCTDRTLTYQIPALHSLLLVRHLDSVGCYLFACLSDLPKFVRTALTHYNQDYMESLKAERIGFNSNFDDYEPVVLDGGKEVLIAEDRHNNESNYNCVTKSYDSAETKLTPIDYVKRKIQQYQEEDKLYFFYELKTPSNKYDYEYLKLSLVKMGEPPKMLQRELASFVSCLSKLAKIANCSYDKKLPIINIYGDKQAILHLFNKLEELTKQKELDHSDDFSEDSTRPNCGLTL